MCLAGAVVACWSPTQQVAGWQGFEPFYCNKNILPLNSAYSVKTFRKNSIIYILQSWCNRCSVFPKLHRKLTDLAFLYCYEVKSKINSAKKRLLLIWIEPATLGPWRLLCFQSHALATEPSRHVLNRRSLIWICFMQPFTFWTLIISRFDRAWLY